MTDFGSDPYVGIMKGRILQINPLVRIISLTNNIKTQDIRHAAFVLLKSYKYFPLHTIFLVIVDPGVGSPRRAIAAQKDDYYFVGPDNGVLSPILSENKDILIVDLQIPDESSHTFHGRDVFAPAAGNLSQTYSLKDLGPPSAIQTSIDFFWDHETSTGEVVFIDHFGNIITNIPNSMNLQYDKEYLLITTKTKVTLSFKRSYFEGSDVKPFLVLSSFETLEITLRKGRAADILDINPGDRIQIRFIDR
ncbi:MAG: SAM-dependent chlorinase/fluorinase [Candidatus Heimdallarchaeota archaeon]|nr:MAG: SAM-dependent chlorinase/fluorinase [Candidatus Heimdallarchaeota archaeon]